MRKARMAEVLIAVLQGQPDEGSALPRRAYREGEIMLAVGRVDS